MEELAQLPKSLQRAYEVVIDSLNKFKCDQLALAFNGGKDSVVLLHLLHLAINHKNASSSSSCCSLSSIKTIYFTFDNSFEEVNEYVNQLVQQYNLNMITFKNVNVKDGLYKLKSDYPHITAIYMGTRRNDPSGAKLESYAPTDPGWPSFMRINPILDLSYSDVWQFIHHFKLPYCKLYDEGYTSIGEKTNTVPNPALEYVGDDGVKRYRSASYLQNGDKERDGRK